MKRNIIEYFAVQLTNRSAENKLFQILNNKNMNMTFGRKPDEITMMIFWKESIGTGDIQPIIEEMKEQNKKIPKYIDNELIMN